MYRCAVSAQLGHRNLDGHECMSAMNLRSFYWPAGGDSSGCTEVSEKMTLLLS